jgi:anti-sigma factor RsiW
MVGNALVGTRCELAPRDGDLRAVIDGEVADSSLVDLSEHVRTCEECRDRSQGLRATAALVRGRLLTLDAASTVAIDAPPFDRLLVAKPKPWLQRALPRRATPWIARAGAVAAAVALVASLPSVSTFAEGALQSFRVQRVQPITVDAEVLRGRFASASFDEGKVREALRYQGPEKPTITITSQADAASRSGLALRLPKVVPSGVGVKPPRFVVTSSGVADMTVDGPRLVQVAKDAKVTDAALLSRIATLDGANVRIEASPAVIAVWGDIDIPTRVPAGDPWTMPTAAARGPVMFVLQVKSPVVNVPASVDVDGLRDALLKSGSVPPELVQALGAIKDWRTTLPLPSGDSSGLRQVDVDGTTGSVSTQSHNGRTVTTAVWLRDGVVYGAAGDLPVADILAAARSLAPAKP